MIRLLAAAAALLAAWTLPAGAETLDFTAEEIARIVRHGPWPPPYAPDPSNRVSGDPAAIALGRALFFDRRLAPDQAMSCASCHDPAHGWAEAKPVSDGRARLTRNAIGLLDVRTRRWFGWDGGQDSLWAMSLRPIIAPLELAATPESAAALLRADEA
ncbi:MAG: cytochrome c peroxidase, partial [Elsteraceae bacterium]